MWCFQARIQEFTLVGAPWIGEGSGDRQGSRVEPGGGLMRIRKMLKRLQMLQQTFFLLLNVSFPPCFLSPVLLSLSLFLFFFLFSFFLGGARAGSAPAWIRAWTLFLLVKMCFSQFTQRKFPKCNKTYGKWTIIQASSLKPKFIN